MLDRCLINEHKNSSGIAYGDQLSEIQIPTGHWQGPTCGGRLFKAAGGSAGRPGPGLVPKFALLETAGGGGRCPSRVVCRDYRAKIGPVISRSESPVVHWNGEESNRCTSANYCNISPPYYPDSTSVFAIQPSFEYVHR